MLISNEEIVKLVVEAARFYGKMKFQQDVIERLSKIQTSLDQLVFRELIAAYESLNDALVTDNQETKMNRLHFAEQNLLKNTGLNPALSTSNIPNSRLMASAHFGLAVICSLRDDDVMAATHFLRVYRSDPNYARIILLPNIYSELFKPKCSDLFAWYEKEKEIILKNNFELEVFGKTAQGVSMYVLAGISAISMLFSPSGMQSMQRGYGFKMSEEIAGRMMGEANSAHFQKLAIEKLDAELNKRIDDQCRELAMNWLGEK